MGYCVEYGLRQAGLLEHQLDKGRAVPSGDTVCPCMLAQDRRCFADREVVLAR
jgi:hypothetical protein